MSDATQKNKKAPKAKAPRAPKPQRSADEPNPAWYKPVMFGFMLLGLIWILTYYISGAQYPLGAALSGVWNLGAGNILIGFGIAMVGFIMTTRWK